MAYIIGGHAAPGIPRSGSQSLPAPATKVEGRRYNIVTALLGLAFMGMLFGLLAFAPQGPNCDQYNDCASVSTDWSAVLVLFGVSLAFAIPGFVLKCKWGIVYGKPEDETD